MSVSSLTKTEIGTLLAEQRKRYAGEDLRRAFLTELRAALALKNPAPFSDRPKHVPDGPMTHAERDAMRDHQVEQVADDLHVRAAKMRRKHPYIVDGHHLAQWEHDKEIHAEANRLMAKWEDEEGISS